jgi:hypothetical protein
MIFFIPSLGKTIEEWYGAYDHGRMSTHGAPLAVSGAATFERALHAPPGL